MSESALLSGRPSVANTRRHPVEHGNRAGLYRAHPLRRRRAVGQVKVICFLAPRGADFVKSGRNRRT